MRPLQFYDKTFVNESGETVPPYGVLKITGWEADRNERDHFTATKPDGSEGIFLLNSMFPVPDGKIGHLTDHNGMRAKVKTGSPENGEIWGPTDGDWGLVKDAPGFKIVGDFAAGAVRVMFAETPAASAGGAFAIVVGTVPAASGIASFVNLETAMITPGLLTATSSDGAWLLNPADGKPMREAPVNVINGGLTQFIGENDGAAVSGSLMSVDGEDYFILPRYELRTEPGFVLGTDPEDDAQGLYHEGNARDQKLGREDCP